MLKAKAIESATRAAMVAVWPRIKAGKPFFNGAKGEGGK